jgi:hypothetical protein
MKLKDFEEFVLQKFTELENNPVDFGRFLRRPGTWAEIDIGLSLEKAP